MPTLRMGRSLIAATLLAGCLGDAPSGPAGRLAIAVAPLNLSGVTDAEYTITVTNAAAGAGEVVWTRALSSQQYGDGAGSASYVGSCDAATGVNTVKLELTALYDATGLVPVGTYMNPTPVLREATCVQNTDVPVQFDITLARQADQGFFDIAVQFRDIFCSAKLDCQKPDGTDLDLLHAPGGARDMTVVMGFACTGSLTGSTYLYMDDLVIDCAGQAQDVRVSPVGLGNITPTANPGGYLFGAAVFRGVEGFASKAYWNVSLGLNAATFASSGACTLKTRATASAEPFPQEPGGFPLPAGAVYPVIDWQIQLSSATGRTCTTHEVNGGNGVATNYLGYLPLVNGFTWANDPIALQHRFEPATGVVLSAGAPLCNPGCDHGVCTAQGGDAACNCDGTGYSGDSCATPVCTAPCVNGGACTAPDTCDCAGTGYEGATCADDLDECATANGGCAQTCTNSAGSFTCSCGSGYTLNINGLACDDVNECASGNGGCAQGCTNNAGAYACSCTSGYLLAGDLHGCDDVDECLTNNGECGDATSYTCTNNVGAAPTCADIDECATSNGGCSPNAQCTNTAGSHSCACQPGYTGDGVTCTPCGAGSAKSAYGAAACTACAAGSATNLTGQTACTPCAAGSVQPATGASSCTTCGIGSYDDNGDETCAACTTCAAGTWTSTLCSPTTNAACTPCADVALCTVAETCSNASNSACTTCAAGYTQPSAGAACTDIDECWAGTDSCAETAVCTNTPGGFTCACEAGTLDVSGNGTICAYPTGCNALHAAQPTLPSGTYLVDPDGAAASLAPFAAYCDMSWDGGGWTLIRSTTASVCLGTEGPVATGTASYLAAATVQALANSASQVHIRTTGQPATRSATSVANALAIQNLRLARVLNYGATSWSGVPAAQAWSGPMVPDHLTFTCAPQVVSWPHVYHACGNGNAMHLIGNTVQCAWTDNAKEAIEVYVR